MSQAKTPYNLRERPTPSRKLLENQALDLNPINNESFTENGSALNLPSFGAFTRKNNTEESLPHDQDRPQDDDGISDNNSNMSEESQSNLPPSNIVTTDCNTQMLLLLQNLSNRMEKIEQNLSENNQQMKKMNQDLNETNRKIEQQTNVLTLMIDQKINYYQQQMDHRIQENEEKWKNEMKAHKEETRQSHNQLNDKFQTKLQEINSTVKCIYVEKKEEEEILRKEIKTIKSTLRDTNQALTTKIEQNNEEVNQILSEHSDSINKLKMNSDKGVNVLNDLPELVMQCSGTIPSTLKFSGRANNPKEFLDQLHKYYLRMKDRRLLIKSQEKDFLHEIVEQSLEQHAFKWWQLIKENIETWHDFSSEFTNKYWSHEVQRGVKQRIEVEKYRPGGYLTRAEYFVERVITLKTICPTPSEEEIVILLAEHFSDIIKDARRVQNITTVRDFELLLQREDHQDQYKNISSRNKTYYNPKLEKNNIPAQQAIRHRPQQEEINTQAYEPRNPHQETRKIPHFNTRNHEQGYSGEMRSQTFNHNKYPQRHPQDQPFPPRRYPTKEQAQACQIIMERTNENREVDNNDVRTSHPSYQHNLN